MADKYYLLDIERTCISGEATYWNQRKYGYTQDLKDAGKFSAYEANLLVNSDKDERTVKVDADWLDKIMKGRFY